MTRDVSDLARLLADHDTLRAALLATHTARPDGRCRACGSQTGLASRWPCRLHSAAEQGARLAGDRHRPTGPRRDPVRGPPAGERGEGLAGDPR
ncbi:hypothetical protein [Pseudonocardia sp. HH130630-07]|uniref:hypothetical protein n=1 Tax=Pseudonocardia sp. HH130630-07 TaxID=1690815 RepID=UPI000814E6CD|nr:hypothetical protein [Pseudonocardia sp. HH130630-07]ANY06686.1 hypothetical protein AFB00_10705 [Pseudonocardia sp. HH130630-07]